MIKLEYVTVLPGELCSVFYVDDRDRRSTNPLYQMLNVNGKLYLKLRKSLFQSKAQADGIRKLYNLSVQQCDCIYPKGRIKLVSKSDFDKFSGTAPADTFDYLMPLSQLSDKESFDTLPVKLNELIYAESIAEFLTVGHDDRKWLSNKLAALYNDIDGKCVVSLGVSHVTANGGWSEQYEDQLTCRGQVNKKTINPKTGNKFWIGFNYNN